MSSPIPIPSRVNLACEQLDVAIELFFAERSYVASLTLAGAAEEIFGSTLEGNHRKHTMALRFEERVRLLGRANLPVPLRNDFIYHQNYPRNAAKHATKKFGSRSRRVEDQYFRADPHAAAKSMILRALHNQKLLEIPQSNLGHKFYGWHLSTIYCAE